MALDQVFYLYKISTSQKLNNLKRSHRFTYEVGRLNCYARGPITKDDTTKWAQFIFPPSMYVMLAIQAVVPIHRDLGQMEENGNQPVPDECLSGHFTKPNTSTKFCDFINRDSYSKFFW